MKIGLLLEGGGMRGLYTAGVLDPIDFETYKHSKVEFYAVVTNIETGKAEYIKIEEKNVVLLEIGVGFNTPGIIRFPFEQMTYQHLKTTLIRVNKDYPMVRQEIKHKTISFDEDINKILNDLKERAL